MSKVPILVPPTPPGKKDVLVFEYRKSKSRKDYKVVNAFKMVWKRMRDSLGPSSQIQGWDFFVSSEDFHTKVIKNDCIQVNLNINYFGTPIPYSRKTFSTLLYLLTEKLEKGCDFFYITYQVCISLTMLETFVHGTLLKLN